ncbi:glutathione S-transferase family protein [Aureimonas pseudogalii]|uniref:Glutathione S-transferase n=1 Tax=Aureimonas pseudogalii TaxID=1744844 RepID=A0A7W6EBA2_9HYPH|nr:glutathione S-transferase family protein [Aureimonas pseudogalii]MBB3998152.1 glutathione S-transferase [Aureimonas pseudogalii]
MSEELVFYTNPMSRGRIVRWMLEEVGAPYRTELLEYGTTMKSAEYRAINPMGKVPAIRHGAAVVTEAAAICCYLADAFPEAGLAPEPGPARADYYRWLFFGAGPLEAAITNRSIGVSVAEDQSRMVGYGTFEQTMATLDYAVSRHPFVAGDRFTAADVYVGAGIGFGLRFGSIERRPAFVAYHERLASRPALRRAQEIDDELMRRMQASAE